MCNTETCSLHPVHPNQVYAPITTRAWHRNMTDGTTGRRDVDIISYLIVFSPFLGTWIPEKNCACVFEIFKIIPGFWTRAQLFYLPFEPQRRSTFVHADADEWKIPVARLFRPGRLMNGWHLSPDNAEAAV